MGPPVTMVEQVLIDHFNSTYKREKRGRFIVPLPKTEDAKSLGELRSLAMQRFTWLEQSLWTKGKFLEFADAVQEYSEQGHAKPVPSRDLEKPYKDVFYLPMHAVTRTSSSTTWLRVVFDTSAKSKSGVLLNDQLLVGPTVHAPLLDAVLRF